MGLQKGFLKGGTFKPAQCEWCGNGVGGGQGKLSGGDQVQTEVWVGVRVEDG